MTEFILEDPLLTYVNNNIDFILQYAALNQKNCATPEIDYATIYASMKDYNESQEVLVNLGKAIQLWRFMNYHQNLQNSFYTPQLSLPNEVNSINYHVPQEVYPNPPFVNYINSPYITQTADQFAPIQPLLSKKGISGKMHNFKKSSKPSQRQNHNSKAITQPRTTMCFKSESNVIYKLFRSLNLLYTYIEDILPLPREEVDFENPASFAPIMNVDSMLFGKLFAGSQPATLCLQTLIKRMFEKTINFSGNLQQLANKFIMKDQKLYMECNFILSKLQSSIDQMNFYTVINFNFKNGAFLCSNLYSSAESLLKVLENLIELVREANIFVHLFNWEMTHRDKKPGAFYTKEQQESIVLNYFAHENEEEILNELFKNTTFLTNAEELNLLQQNAENESNDMNIPEKCFEVKGYYEPTSLFNSTRRHGA